MVITESLCKFDGENTRLEYRESTASVARICGIFVEHLWKNIYGEHM